MKKIFLLIGFLLPVLAIAQGENDNWYFGFHAALNFATPTPVTINNSQLNTMEACGSVSDANGDLLFYTDGNTIWDRQHQVMQNGTGLTGQPSSQQLVIAKHPGNPHQYFVFTTSLNYINNSSPVAYSIVDMSQGAPGLNGNPLGRVPDSAKNIPVLDNLGSPLRSEAITIVPSAFGTYWILIANGGRLYAYTLNGSGLLNGTPVISNLNIAAPMQPSNHYSIKASPKLTGAAFSHYLCITSWANPDNINKVFSFNHATGQITNDYTLEINGINAYLSEFNKDASVLFLGFTDLYAVDLITSTSSAVNMTLLYHLPGSPINSTIGAIQRNKYDDIYVSAHHSAYLGKILNPDIYGPGISVNMNFVSLGFGHAAQLGLPQLVPQLQTDPYSCIPDILLTTPETYALHTYQAANTITAKERYTVFPTQDITMKAGNSVTLLPNAYIMNGATYFATIASCKPGVALPALPQQPAFHNRVPEADKEPAGSPDVVVYPNPASSVAAISTSGERIGSWELYDVSGKMVRKGNDYEVKVNGLPAKVYLLKIHLENGEVVSRELRVR